MRFKMDRVHVWSGEVADQVGATASKLAFLAQAGANLEYVFTKRLPDKPGRGVLYVAPVTGPTQVRAAREAGLTETFTPVVHRLEGDNQAGLAHRVTQQWAVAGISLQGLTMAVLHRIEGDNQAGLAHRLTQAWELANISLQGMTLAVLGGKFVGYVAFDTPADANRAAQILADLGTAPPPAK